MIGLGWPGQRHLEGYVKIPFVNVAAICDMSEALLVSTHARFPSIETATTDYQC